MILVRLICELDLLVMMPPIRPEKKRDGDDNNDQPKGKLLRFEHHEEQHDAEQYGDALRQIVDG
jgi:hypothetical protein